MSQSTKPVPQLREAASSDTFVDAVDLFREVEEAGALYAAKLAALAAKAPELKERAERKIGRRLSHTHPTVAGYTARSVAALRLAGESIEAIRRLHVDSFRFARKEFDTDTVRNIVADGGEKDIGGGG